MSAKDNIEYQEPWNEDELTQIPLGFEPLLVTGFTNREIVFSAKWRSEALIAPAPTGPWHIIQPGTDKREPLTTSHWRIVHPGIQHLDITVGITSQGHITERTPAGPTVRPASSMTTVDQSTFPQKKKTKPPKYHNF